MNISEPFIKRPVMTTLTMLAIAFFGVLAYLSLPVSDMPSVEFPTIQVDITYPGADPITIANNVVTPLEQQFSTIPGIQVISSNSVTGSATILLQFELSRSIDLAAPDVLAGINAASQQLPKDLPYAPTYSKTNPTSTPLLIFSLTSDTLTDAELYDYAYSILGRQLNMVNGVSEVQVWGTPYAVRLRVDPQKLAARDIGFNEFGKTIQEANVYLPTGNLYNAKKETTIDCEGQLTNAEGYSSLIIKTKDGLITRLSDLGMAYDGLWNDKIYTHYSNSTVDKSMVGIGIQKQNNANTLDIIKGVNARLELLQKELPASLQIWRVYDQSDYIEESVHDVQMTLIIALILVLVVIFLYLGRIVNTIIPSLAIPISVLGTFVIMQFAGFSIDILSLLSITLAIGFLVDDAIVMLENIARHAEEGKSRLEAALIGSREISITIITMTVCLAAIFIPLVFMGGIIGRVLREFSITIVAAILFSGLVSFTATPLMCSRLVAARSHEGKSRLERFSEKLNASMIKYYIPSLKWAIHHRLLILGGGVLCLAATLYLLTVLPKDFLPDDDIGFVQCFVQAEDGTSPFGIAEKVEEMTKILQKNPSVNQLIALGAVSQHNQGLFYIQLVDIKKRLPTRELLPQFYQQLSSVLGVQVFLRPLPLINLQVGATTSKGDYQYTLQSLEAEDLYKNAEDLLQRLTKLPQITQVTSDMDIDQPQVTINILRDKASRYGITAQEIENTLSLAFADINLSPINEPDNQYYVIMEVLPEFYSYPDRLSQLWLRSTNGGLVALSEVVELTQTIGPLTLNHINGLPSATITFNLAPNVPLETALNAIHKESVEVLASSNVFGSVQGSANIFKQSFENLNFLVLVTFFIIYVILGILYENFFHPVTVMSTLPPAAFGGMLTLLIFGYSFSLYAFVGIIMLLGIVLKNGIILIDFANESSIKENKPAEEAILHACEVRLRPILMTTFAAMMGAVPIALGIGGITAQGRRPLGAAIVGGLIVSQILTLYLTPITYLYVEKWRKKWKG